MVERDPKIVAYVKVYKTTQPTLVNCISPDSCSFCFYVNNISTIYCTNILPGKGILKYIVVVMLFDLPLYKQLMLSIFCISDLKL